MTSRTESSLPGLRAMRRLLLPACLLLGACSSMGGYPNHALAPSLSGPTPQAQDDKTTYLQLIGQMQQQGAYYASLAHIDAFRLRYGDPPELRRLQADALRETGQADAAEAIYQGLVNGNQAAAAWHGLGLIAVAQGQPAQADQDLQKAVQLQPINASYLSDLGYARLHAGQLDNAHEPLAKAAELAPGDLKINSNLALWALLRGDGAQAEAIMQHANMPQPTRDAVQKLALQLRASAQPVQAPAAAAAAAPPAATSVAVANTPPTHALPRRVPAPGEIAGIPGTLLDRFGSAPASKEANP